jgi:o-succinylbenzoate synthase
MKIVDIQWLPYRVPFVNSFTTAHGIMTAREGAIVEITTDQGIAGVGEIAPLPEFAGSCPTETYKQLPAIAAYLRGKTVLEALNLIHADSLALTALCGLETALRDAQSKAKGCSISTLLSPNNIARRSFVAVNAVIGAKATRAVVAAAREARNNGFGCVKLKVGVGESIRQEIERIAAVREAIGPEIHLRLDANEAWNLEEAITILSRCVPYNIQYVEQPLKAQDLSAMRILRHTIPIPIAADEALHDLESTRLVMEHEAADILVIKPQLAGGLRMGQQIIAEAAEHDIQCVITSTIETGIWLTAALHLAAASPTVTLECGLATLPLLADDLLVDDLFPRNGFIKVPAGPGLGVELDREALKRYCI